jgi:CubicO group peptidase (beta-lactamase class C family)
MNTPETVMSTVQRDEAWLTDAGAGLLPAGISVPSRAGRQITLGDLATHTSGLPRLPADMRPQGLRRPRRVAPEGDRAAQQLGDERRGHRYHVLDERLALVSAPTG